MQRITQLWKSGTRGKLLIGCGGLLVLAFIFALTIAIWAYLGIPVALILALAFYKSSTFRNGAYSRLPWLRRIPGFGAGNPQHMAIATLVYIVPVSLVLLAAMVSGQQKPPSPVAVPTPTQIVSISPTPAPLIATATPKPTEVPVATSTPKPTEVPVAISTPKPTEVPVATSTALPPTATPAPPTPTQAPPTSTPQPAMTPMATLVPTSGSTAPLGPGLASADVKLNLERRGFKCSAASERQGIISGTCDKKVGVDNYHLEWYGRDLRQLDFLDATAVVGEGETAKTGAAEYLTLIATFHFDAAQEAKSWVIATMPLVGTPGVVKETTIAGVHFKLFGGPGAYTLEMGTLY